MLRSDSIDIALMAMNSTVWIGSHSSAGFNESESGGWRMEMQTQPDGCSILRYYIGHRKRTVGGLFGKSSGKRSSVGKTPLAYTLADGPTIEQRYLKGLSPIRLQEK
jgi:hypothetical protein